MDVLNLEENTFRHIIWPNHNFFHNFQFLHWSFDFQIFFNKMESLEFFTNFTFGGQIIFLMICSSHNLVLQSFQLL